ncbi:MAG: tRNA (adenosine(37)-N6)-threonylcarbamoyltransferase complex ATPase subunit type 1 TsaE [Candidatus Paceibacterota bacterium]|jgi:tRNA threonylcarbamoyladenosine biosynthesis protein TsaE
MKKSVFVFSSSFISSSADETKKIGERFGVIIKSTPPLTRARVITLRGDLGTGKTTFTKGAAKGFDVKKRITSPTFVLIKRFPIQSKYYKNFIHIDAYRLSSFHDLEQLEIHSFLNDPSFIIFIEWPERVSSKIVKSCGSVTLKHKTNETRLITIKLSQ